MKTYDAIIVLGSQPDFRTWRFPSHTYDSLDRAIDLVNQGVAPYLALSGDHAIKYDHTGIEQPFKEADAMEGYALSKGLPASRIRKENISRDTVANFYYLKNLVLSPAGSYSILLITTKFRIERLQFLWQKVMGSDYTLEFMTVPYGNSDLYRSESETLRLQQEWLKNVVDGDDGWFADKFYEDPYYLRVKARDEARLKSTTNPRDRYLI